MSDLPLTLAGISKTVAAINRPYREQRQIDIAQTLFEWWWRVSNDGQYSPRWENCTQDIQAFWMDGAWRVLSGVPFVTLPATSRNRRISPHSDRRAPFKQLVGWASARGLQVVADQEIGNTNPINISKEESPTYAFPVYTEDPPKGE